LDDRAEIVLRRDVALVFPQIVAQVLRD
jgi:hypothetical protein